jgi:hypothetical protein
MLRPSETKPAPVPNRLARVTLDAAFLGRVRKMSLILGGVLAVMFAFYAGAMPALGWTAGIAWSLVNLAVVASLVRNVVRTEARDVAAIVVTLALKFPVLYATAVVLLVVLKLPALWWMAGFSWPFFVLLMKSAGRVYLRLDELA